MCSKYLEGADDNVGMHCAMKVRFIWVVFSLFCSPAFVKLLQYT